MIKVTNLSKSFGDKIAVNNLNFIVPEGKIVGFIGPNGAGKSTTLKMITGILQPTKGNIELNGYDIESQSLLAKKQFGIVFDSPDNFLGLKGIEYLTLISKIYEVDPTNILAKIDELAKAFKLDMELNNLISSYSHGMRQKIMIIGCLIHSPSIWLLDEPLTGLDPESSLVLKNLMKQHAQEGNTVLFSTHVLEVAEKLCDEIIIINNGQLMYQGTLNNLQTKYPDLSLEDIFFKVISNE